MKKIFRSGGRRADHGLPQRRSYRKKTGGLSPFPSAGVTGQVLTGWGAALVLGAASEAAGLFFSAPELSVEEAAGLCAGGEDCEPSAGELSPDFEGFTEAAPEPLLLSVT